MQETDQPVQPKVERIKRKDILKQLLAKAEVAETASEKSDDVEINKRMTKHEVKV
jgi:hypothetical protein